MVADPLFHDSWILARREASLYRQRQTVEAVDGPIIEVEGCRYINFSSNDYLGMSNHPAVVEAFSQSVKRFGVGARASHLVTGHTAEHAALERLVAEHLQCEKALLFSSGYAANLCVQSALLSRHDVIFQDKLNHASLLDGAKLSGAKLKRYRHVDVGHLEQLLSNHERVKMIATDAVFSMDGDVAPLLELQKLALSRKALLFIDDAHGYGVLGEKGRGSVASQGCNIGEELLQMVTLGKAIGVIGAAVVGSAALIGRIEQLARPYIYTTALPAACAAAARASIQIVQEDSDRRAHLHALIARFRELAIELSLPLGQSLTAIQPIIFGDNALTLKASEMLCERGFWVTAIRPPTVPLGSARLRVALNASHSFEHVDRLVKALFEVYTGLSNE